MMVLDKYLDMQLALKTLMVKKIQCNLIKEVKDFDLRLLVEECMFEEDDIKFEPEASQSFISKTFVEEEFRIARLSGSSL